MKILKGIAFTLVMILIAIGTYQGIIYAFTNMELTESEVHNNIAEIEKIPKKSLLEEGANMVDNLFNTKQIDDIIFMLAGVDEEDSTEYGIDGLTGIRTDTMMLVKANFVTGKVDILSIPRDSRVFVKGKLDKINAAHSYGGISLMMKTVRDFTGVEVDKYIRVDYSAVKSIVDAIGGIEIDVPQRMVYHDTTKGKELHIDFEEGLQTLDGQKAIEFLRFRRYKNGDEGRVAAQQYFMTEFIKQTKTKIGINTLIPLTKTYFNYVTTNFSLSDMLDIAKMSDKIDINNIHVNTILGEGKYIGDISYFVVDEEGTKEQIKSIFAEYMENENKL